MALTDIFIDRLCSIRFEDISAAAIDKLKVCLADTVGVALAGAKDLADKESDLLGLLDDGSEVVSPIGMDRKTSLANAIFINGLSSHFLELDDGVRYGVVHPSAPMFSALIPIAKVKKVSWENFVLGAVCGYETSIRIASAMQPSHYSRGYHPTATCCTLGTAVAIAIMLGYSRDEVKDAFSAATISSYGTLKVLEDVSQLKPYNCAKAALMGYYSAMMAKAGFAGPSEPLEGSTGFISMMCDQFNEEILVGDRDFLYVEKIYLKPYASCRHTHPEIEAAQYIRSQGVDPHDVEEILVSTYKGVIGKHDGTDIYGESSARMSIPYSVAISLCTGKAGIEEFSEPFVNDDFILGLTRKVKVVGDEELSKLVPEKRCAVVTVKTKDGNCYSHKVEYPKGEPENPLTPEELYSKFASMTSHAGISDDCARQMFRKIIDL